MAQIAQTSMGVVDTIMVGHYSAVDLAGVAIGFSFWLPVMLFITGLFMGNTAIVAQYFGGRQQQEIIATLHQCLWLGIVIAVAATLLFPQLEFFIARSDAPAAVMHAARQYLVTLSLGIPALVFYQIFRSLNEGMGFTRPMAIINILAFVINIPLNYALIYGHWGAPELGARGCALATALVLWFSLLLMLVFTWLGRRQLLRPVGNSTIGNRTTGNTPGSTPGSTTTTQAQGHSASDLFFPKRSPDATTIGHILQVGLPIAGATFVEISLFAVIALLLAPLGPQVVAGHQIAINCTGLIFMVPLSLGLATTIRTGQALGAGDHQAAKFVAKVSLITGVCLSSLTCALIVFASEQIASIYSSDLAVRAIAAKLLLIAAFYQLPDAIQACSIGALRGYKDTRVPLWLVLFAYWVFALPLGYQLAFQPLELAAPMGARGMWFGLVAGLSAAAVLLAARLLFMQKQSALAEPASNH